MYMYYICSYILDGYPMTKKQVDLMTERCLIPVRVFELDVDSKEIMVRGTRDRITASRFVHFQSFMQPSFAAGIKMKNVATHTHKKKGFPPVPSSSQPVR